MKMRNIMLITFLLLAVLTIGAASATDDIALDNQTASDDIDVIADDNYDDEEHSIEINEDKICLDEDDDDYYDEEEVATITLPDTTTNGSFQILKGDEIVARLDVGAGGDSWDIDEGILTGYIVLKDLDLTKISNGDELSLKFFKIIGEDYVAVDFFTKACKVSLTDSTLILTEIDNGEEDVDIDIRDIDTNNPDENFTYVTVAQKEGIFIISVEGKDDEIVIFKEDLSTTSRPYDEINKNGTRFYRFGFSLTDLNKYINRTIKYAESFSDLVENNVIATGDDVYFEMYEDDEETEIDSKTMIITINPDGMILFDEEEEDEDVDVDYLEMYIVMYEGWENTELLDFIVLKDLEGTIVIYLNDNTTPAFRKDTSELTPDDLEEDEDFDHYIIFLRDLNIAQAGEYVIRDYFYDENGDCIYQYDDEEPEILVLYAPQNMTVDNVTIDVNPIPTTINGNESFITISGNASADDEVLIYVDGSETPQQIKLNECRKDENGNYIIGTEELPLEAGEHDLKIEYKDNNITAKVSLASELEIELPEDNEIIYTDFNDAFVFFRLEVDEIYESDINGTVNLTIIDNDGNVVATLENDIYLLYYDDGPRAFVIRTGDVDCELSGNYTIFVRYFDGNRAATQTQSVVTFKSFEIEDYGTSIKDTITDENDYAVTFKDIPLSDNVLVEVDGNVVLEIPESELENYFDPEKGVYYINQTQLGLEEGPHSISVYVNNDKVGRIDLASGNVIINLEEDIDPALMISIANIEEGNAANVVITTNATYTGNVIVQIGNTNYPVNVVDGKGNIQITGLTANTYTATAIFESNGIFKDSTKTATFTVTPKQTTPKTEANPKADVIKLTLKKVKIKKSAKKLVLKATLKINNKAVKGKVITFKFKGKTYKAKTNKKGVAKVTIKKKVLKKLKVGKKVTYTAKYLNKTVKKTVKVKK